MNLTSIRTQLYKANAEDKYCFTPALACSSEGWLLTFDHGAGRYGRALVSHDRGETWQQTTTFPFWHARPFICGNKWYIMGHCHDVCIIESEDQGKSWSRVSMLTTDEKWHASSGAFVITQDCIHLCFEQHLRPGLIDGWSVADLAPVLWSAPVDGNLLDPSVWRKSPPVSFDQWHEAMPPQSVGIPFWPTQKDKVTPLPFNHHNAPMGWLEGNVVAITSPEHLWTDPAKDRLFLFLRSHTGGTGYAHVVQFERREPHGWSPQQVNSPAEAAMWYLPVPGGHLKFHIVQDPKTNLFWLVSNQPYNSMKKLSSIDNSLVDGLPNNERHRLQLHFSTNCVDWCQAGVINIGQTEALSSCYPCAMINEEELIVVVRASDDEAESPQKTNAVHLYRITNFRKLAY